MTAGALRIKYLRCGASSKSESGSAAELAIVGQDICLVDEQEQSMVLKGNSNTLACGALMHVMTERH